VVFDISAQRVWLVASSGRVDSTYLVSGSLTDNLHPGSYAVYSRSRWAVGVDDSGVMQYFVRFAHGRRAAIGFHSIPTRLGRPLQTTAQLGTPQSHGCIRQDIPDAVRMWNFAPVGTRVVVTA
jgi:lipoprotein-anchoring transpeptidase ErfK/SrfK